jgi:hypothetical protein
VELTVLAVPGCPNAALLDRRLAIAAAGLPDVTVTRRVVDDERQAAALGMRGSPTLLIEAADPFAAPGQSTGLSCRLYLQADGSLRGAPPVESLRRALEGGGSGASSRRQPSGSCHADRDLPGGQAEVWLRPRFPIYLTPKHSGTKLTTTMISNAFTYAFQLNDVTWNTFSRPIRLRRGSRMASIAQCVRPQRRALT